MRRLLERSLEGQFPLEMIYISGKGDLSQRRIRVQEIHTNTNTIRAYCYLRKQTRLFKIENILSAYPLTQKEPNIS